MCSKLFSAAQSENSSQSIGILHQLCFQNNYSMLSVNSKIGRFVKLILFAELALPSWLRHIPRGGTHDIFGRGCATTKSLYRPFLEFLTKSWTLFGIFVRNGGLQSTILRAVLGKKWLPFSKNFPKIVDFLSKLGQRNQSIQSSFGLSSK